MASVRWTETPGPAVKFHCLNCGNVSASGVAVQRVEQLMFLYLIPLFKWTTTSVRCLQCNAKVGCKLNIQELVQFHDADVTPYLTRGSLIVNFLAITSLVVFWAPFMGLILAVVALIVTRRTPGWQRRASAVGLILSTLATLAVVALLLFTKK